MATNLINTNYIEISNPIEIKKSIIYPWSQGYKCKGFGYFFDESTGYGYREVNSHAKDFYIGWRNKILSWFGFYIEWRCDGTGKSKIRKQLNR